MLEYEWGDFRDWTNWQSRSAAQIAQEICCTSGGQWPASVPEWRELLAHYGFTLAIQSGITYAGATHDDLIAIRAHSNPDIVARRICHELAEALANRDGAIRTFHFQSSGDEHHAVARLTERLI